METREQRISFGKSGSGSIQSRIFLPREWIKKMGFDEQNNKAMLEFDDEKITIKKI
ncbi:MAG: AbrB/MazE/SpoVT family DNA-binding domain-containing protein [Intestinibacter sp.]